MTSNPSSSTHVVYVSAAGRRPAYWKLAAHLWGPGCNIDSDGNSRTPDDEEWTKLTLSLRGEPGQFVTVVETPISPLTAYRLGLMTGLTNPKGAAFWTSAFATLLPHAPTWFLATVVVLFALPSLGWHLVSHSYSGLPALRNRYLRLECGIDGIAGEALVLLGLQRLSSR